MQNVEVALAGIAIGVVFGLFGAGGSAFATPILALIGIPGVLAVASPLPAMIPASVVGARRYLKEGNLDRRIARLSVAGGIPGTIIGAWVSKLVGGDRLLILSGLMLLVVGVRILLPDAAGAAGRAAARRDRSGLVVSAAFLVGFLTGLLANGGGFLLVPLYVVVLGLTAVRAAGTSMVVVGVLTIPTLATHWALGHIDWTVALIFAAGVVPASMFGARLSQRIDAAKSRRAFGLLLVGFAVWFLFRQLT